MYIYNYEFTLTLLSAMIENPDAITITFPAEPYSVQIRSDAIRIHQVKGRGANTRK